jgi:PAS domain S-box-containing protein
VHDPPTRSTLGDQGARSPGVLRALAIAGIAVAAYGAWLYFRLGGEQVTLVVDDVGGVSAAAGATVLTGIRAAMPAARSVRLGWLFMCLTCAALGVGDATYAYYQLAQHIDVPFPSLADVAYLSGASLGVVAVLLLAGLGWAPSRLRLVLDGVIVAGALLLVSWLTTLHAIYTAGSDSPLKLALSLAYPVVDVVTIVIIVSAISHVQAVNPSLVVVALGMISIAVSDSVFTYLGSLNLYRASNVTDVGYVAGYLLIGLAALTGRQPRDIGKMSLSRWQSMLPYGPLLVAVLAVMGTALADRALDSRSQVGLVGLVVLVGLVLVRQMMVVLESQSLTARLNSAVGALEEALERWKDASSERETLIEQAPVGICRLDGEGRFLSVNRALEAMLGHPAARFVGQPFSDFLRPEDGLPSLDGAAGAGAAGSRHPPVEVRGVRSNGEVIWCSATMSALDGHDSGSGRLVGIVEDVTDRKLQTRRAAHVQRQLLPQAVLQLDGYELAGACRPAEDVAGDFYDWVTAADGGLDVTVADVMGKGVGAALVMAVVRTALRSASPALGPAERVRLAAESIGLGMSGEGLFVTLFHARLAADSGLLTYVDAGHGYCAIRRADGEIVHLGERSLPVGIRDDEVFQEGTAQLSPGDTLLVYSDGLVETDERTVGLEELVPDLDASTDVTDVVTRLMGRMPDRPPDDVTLLALRRLPLLAPGLPARRREPDVSIECVAVPEELETIHRAMAGFWLRLEPRPDDDWRMRFELAVSEVAANIIEHARPDLMSLRLSAEADVITARFRYEGPGWTDTRRAAEPDPMAERGRGLFLARTGVDEVIYNRVGATVNWRLVKRR